MSFEKFFPFVTALVGVFVGYYLTRWQKHREFFYQKKLERYESFVAALIDFCSVSAAESDPALAYRGFKNLIDALHATEIYLPRKLHYDLHTLFQPAVRGVARVYALKVDSNFIAGPPGLADLAPEFKKGIVPELPAPFTSIHESVDKIIKMMKKDLGVEKIGRGFYIACLSGLVFFRHIFFPPLVIKW